ncbi:MAG TPA: 50S ribosomal protein L4 [Anaerolineae bacterium]|nr:50S ribosomal protein L4 [Anaerolineae bacterium]
MQAPLMNMQGQEIGTVELPDDIFNIEVNEAVMHQALVRQLANKRLGTHKTKTRGEVRGGGRKPWRQKGTGRARQGSIRAPQWRGGGTVFGPRPRSYAKRMPRKMRRLALRSALTVKAQAQEIIVLDELSMEAPRTKAMAAMMDALGVERKALILLPESNENVELSARNLPNVKTLRANYLNVRDLLGYNVIVMPRQSIDVIASFLSEDTASEPEPVAEEE